ncbi:MAG: PmoA family protein [Bacteroidota bacterium]
MKNIITLAMFFLGTLLSGCHPAGKLPEVKLLRLDSLNRVDVLFDNQPFTSYIYPENMEKAVLYPVRSAGGTIITRGFPLEPRSGERVDHPHHVGIWFNYGDVNGYDFWNNSYAVPQEDKHHFGRIFHQEITRAESGSGKGILEVTALWKAPGDTLDKTLLKEETTFIFSGDSASRMIDRITKLTALDRDVLFTDNKEGLFAIRVDRAFEYPDDKPQIFTDASGNPTEVPAMDNAGVSGRYHGSNGIDGLEVWGTRASWVSLSGTREGQPLTIVIFDHPENPGYPGYWHARGYGLFAVNNLGQKIFSDGKEELNFRLPAGTSVTFRHRLAVFNGDALSDDVLNACAEQFSSQK